MNDAGIPESGESANQEVMHAEQAQLTAHKEAQQKADQVMVSTFDLGALDKNEEQKTQA